MKKNDITVKIEAISESHAKAKIYKNGRVYSAIYAKPFPDEHQVLVDYTFNPLEFRPDYTG